MIIFLTGMPLAGKTTWGRRLAGETNMPFLSTGELARGLGMGMEESIRTLDLSLRLDGQIIKAVVDFISRGVDCIVDGYPRSRDQYGIVNGFPHRVVFVQANPLVIYDRMLLRFSEQGRPEDAEDVVIGRIRRSAEWMAELRTLAGDRLTCIDESEGYEAFRRVACER